MCRCVVYSTCSIEEEENAAVVRRFLERAGGAFALEAEQQLLPFRDKVRLRTRQAAAAVSPYGGLRQCLPQPQRMRVCSCACVAGQN